MDLVLRMFETGRALAQLAPVFRVLIPLVGFVGSGILFAWGVMGLLNQRTFALARRGAGGRVHGVPAMIVGALYLAISIVLVVILAPLSAGLVVGPR
ncbi:hypothetical protein [Sandaracinus amylolyticus]|nr:hypothetical protein [Sandaracinus amylolyticus]